MASFASLTFPSRLADWLRTTAHREDLADKLVEVSRQYPFNTNSGLFEGTDSENRPVFLKLGTSAGRTTWQASRLGQATRARDTFLNSLTDLAPEQPDM